MRALLLLAFALSWISCCLGCGAHQTPESHTRELAARLESETVALVALLDEDGEPSETGHPTAYCAGVFVSRYVIVTAGHCVEAFAEHPIGQRALYLLQGDPQNAYWTGKVLAHNHDADLGAIVVDAPYPVHAFAHVSEGEIEDGDRVEVVGHPGGVYGWSYVEGVVSSQRPDEPNGDGKPMPTLQVEGPFSGGNSGGGAFDAAGRLIGVASYIDRRANGMGFFVHRDAVLKFLHAAKAI